MAGSKSVHQLQANAAAADLALVRGDHPGKDSPNRPVANSAGSSPGQHRHPHRHYRWRWSPVRPCAGPMGQYWGMRIVSLLPSATEIVYALGLAEHLVGVEAMLVSVFRVT